MRDLVEHGYHSQSEWEASPIEFDLVPGQFAHVNSGFIIQIHPDEHARRQDFNSNKVGIVASASTFVGYPKELHTKKQIRGDHLTYSVKSIAGNNLELVVGDAVLVFTRQCGMLNVRMKGGAPVELHAGSVRLTINRELVVTNPS